jgi:hypothetical protein
VGQIKGGEEEVRHWHLSNYGGAGQCSGAVVTDIHDGQCGGFIGFGRCGLCCTDCALFLYISLFSGYKKGWLVALVVQSRHIIQ